MGTPPDNRGTGVFGLRLLQLQSPSTRSKATGGVSRKKAKGSFDEKSRGGGKGGVKKKSVWIVNASKPTLKPGPEKENRGG